jgi:hypothetical protein
MEEPLTTSDETLDGEEVKAESSDTGKKLLASLLLLLFIFLLHLQDHD